MWFSVFLLLVVCCGSINVFGRIQRRQAPSNGGRSREEVERLLAESDLFSAPGSTEALHTQIVFASEEAQALGKEGQQAIEFAKSPSAGAASGFGGAAAGGGGFGGAGGVPAHSPPHTIRKEPACLQTKYRSFDGSCNNLRRRNWGQSFRSYNRLMPAQYEDHISAPRMFAKDGSRLPSTRLVSTTVLGNEVVEFTDVSVLFSFFGQFLDHDLSLTPASKSATGQTFLCCDERVIRMNLVHPDCLAIEIPTNDPFYSQFNQTCMQFTRSLPAPPDPLFFGFQVQEQMNHLTAYIDGSQVYGSKDDQAGALRLKEKGKLKVSTGEQGRDFPPNRNSEFCVGDVSHLTFCFLAGDVRSAETPQLATLQVIFLREHNRVAEELSQLNPSWDDEKIYQEARKIVGAKLQHISYNEFIPIVLGNRVTTNYDLTLQKQGFWNGYDPDTDATILNEFSAAAYRYGHSNIPSMVELYSGDQNTQNQRLRDHFMQPYDGKLFDNYVGGLANQASLVTDNEVSKELTEHLFQRGNKSFGLDLPAITMQRGRDHAIGTYAMARNICGLATAKTFDDLNFEMYTSAPKRLASIYKTVEDVDLWIGGVSEIPLPGAVVGPTFACILGEQFKRTRKGDRFWYENGGSMSSFTEAQLEQIRLSSMSRVICDNSDLPEIQPSAFLKPSNWNSKVPCENYKIPKPSVQPWLNR